MRARRGSRILPRFDSAEETRVSVKSEQVTWLRTELHWQRTENVVLWLFLANAVNSSISSSFTPPPPNPMETELSSSLYVLLDAGCKRPSKERVPVSWVGRQRAAHADGRIP